MNLRGAVVPVVDMRSALGIASEEYGQFTVIIVLSVHGRTVGFVVDSVSDVLSFDPSAIELAPDLGGRVDLSLVSGIARSQDRFVILLDVERVAGIDVIAQGAA
jgi:purine-binding chemotaxis protein CheW